MQIGASFLRRRGPPLGGFSVPATPQIVFPVLVAPSFHIACPFEVSRSDRDLSLRFDSVFSAAA